MSTRQPFAADKRHSRYQFLDFTLDLDAGFLYRGSHEVPLRPKAFEVLTYLVERQGRLVGKDELIEVIWPDAAVTDNSLSQCLKDLRRALSDEEQEVIRTVARRGYVFAAPVTTSPVIIPGSFGDGANLAPPFSGPAVRIPAGRLNRKSVAMMLFVFALAAVGILAVRFTAPRNRELVYTQLTDFTDSAVGPALSPDGRMVAFVRGESAFMHTDQIFVKLLPSGEAIQLTHDPRPKYGLAFSADGSKIAYTVVSVGMGPAQNVTYAISPLGGEPSVFLANAAGLTWLDDRDFLFSEIRTGMHMGIVRAGPNRAGYREVYFPAHERAMAHYSFAAPDRRSALVVEMDHRPRWLRCRLVPLDGSSPGRQVGPEGYCTGAGWSPDGKWMYFTAVVDEKHHLWRQRFTGGEPEQLTFGAASEDGIAVAPDGSIVTSIGLTQSAMWILDRSGERPLSSEADVVMHFGTVPSFSPDAAHLYYLLRASAEPATELWRTNVESGRSDPVLPGVDMVEFDVSPDERQILFTTQPAGKAPQIWLASLDEKLPARRITSEGETTPHFGPGGTVLFRFADNNANYLGRINHDGSGRSRVVEYPISTIQSVSPDRRWVVAIAPAPGEPGRSASIAVPSTGGPPRRICANVCHSAWSPDGRLFYVEVEHSSRTTPGRMVALPVPPETGLPVFPEGGIESPAQALAIPGGRVVERSDIVPGLDPSAYAFVKTNTHRNLFRIVVP